MAKFDDDMMVKCLIASSDENVYYVVALFDENRKKNLAWLRPRRS